MKKTTMKKRIEKIIYKKLKTDIGGVIVLDTSSRLAKKITQYIKK
jgi:acyl carrier protein